MHKPDGAKEITNEARSRTQENGQTGYYLGTIVCSSANGCLEVTCCDGGGLTTTVAVHASTDLAA